MLFAIGMIILIIAICVIIYNKPKDQNVFEAIIESGDKYVDHIVTHNKTPPKKKKEVHQDIPVIIGDDTDKSLEEPKSLGKGGMKNERRCRKILEEIFGVDFPTVRPKWLKNKATNRNLELDCYNHQLRIAIEYQGKQHTEMTKYHKNQNELIYQIRKDQYKAQECKRLGITLICVPYWVLPVNLKDYITNKLKEAGKYPKDKL